MIRNQASGGDDGVKVKIVAVADAATNFMLLLPVFKRPDRQRQGFDLARPLSTF